MYPGTPNSPHDYLLQQAQAQAAQSIQDQEANDVMSIRNKLMDTQDAYQNSYPGMVPPPRPRNFGMTQWDPWTINKKFGINPADPAIGTVNPRYRPITPWTPPGAPPAPPQSPVLPRGLGPGPYTNGVSPFQGETGAMGETPTTGNNVNRPTKRKWWKQRGLFGGNIGQNLLWGLFGLMNARAATEAATGYMQGREQRHEGEFNDWYKTQQVQSLGAYRTAQANTGRTRALTDFLSRMGKDFDMDPDEAMAAFDEAYAGQSPDSFGNINWDERLGQRAVINAKARIEGIRADQEKAFGQARLALEKARTWQTNEQARKVAADLAYLTDVQTPLGKANIQRIKAATHAITLNDYERARAEIDNIRASAEYKRQQAASERVVGPARAWSYRHPMAKSGKDPMTGQKYPIMAGGLSAEAVNGYIRAGISPYVPAHEAQALEKAWVNGGDVGNQTSRMFSMHEMKSTSGTGVVDGAHAQSWAAFVDRANQAWEAQWQLDQEDAAGVPSPASPMGPTNNPGTGGVPPAYAPLPGGGEPQLPPGFPPNYVFPNAGKTPPGGGPPSPMPGQQPPAQPPARQPATPKRKLSPNDKVPGEHVILGDHIKNLERDPGNAGPRTLRRYSTMPLTPKTGPQVIASLKASKKMPAHIRDAAIAIVEWRMRRGGKKLDANGKIGQ